MDRTKIVVELLPEDPSADRFIAGLTRAFDVLCSDLGCNIDRKKEFRIDTSFSEGLEIAVKSAANILELEEDHTACVYVSPRKFFFKCSGSAVTPPPVNALIVAIATKSGPTGLFVHAISKNGVPDIVGQSITNQLESVRNRLLVDTTEFELETAERLAEALQHGIALSCVLHAT